MNDTGGDDLIAHGDDDGTGEPDVLQDAKAALRRMSRPLLLLLEGIDDAGLVI